MRPAPRPTPSDPDFDAAPVALPGPTRDEVGPYQRLVVNPVLAIAALGSIGAATVALGTHHRLVPALMLALLAVPLLVHYHCLDCGSTGPYLRRKRHACLRVRERWLAASPPSWLPEPSTQLWLWGSATFVGFGLWIGSILIGRAERTPPPVRSGPARHRAR